MVNTKKNVKNTVKGDIKMLKKIKTWVAKKQKEQAQKQQLIKAKKYYKLIQEGALFLQFIQNDMNEMTKKQVNRHMRRRFEKSLQDFKLNEETLQYYKVKIDSILNYISVQLNSSKKPAVPSKGETKTNG